MSPRYFTTDSGIDPEEWDPGDACFEIDAELVAEGIAREEGHVWAQLPIAERDRRVELASAGLANAGMVE